MFSAASWILRGAKRFQGQHSWTVPVRSLVFWGASVIGIIANSVPAPMSCVRPLLAEPESARLTVERRIMPRIAERVRRRGKFLCARFGQGSWGEVTGYE